MGYHFSFSPNLRLILLGQSWLLAYLQTREDFGTGMQYVTTKVAVVKTTARDLLANTKDGPIGSGLKYIANKTPFFGFAKSKVTEVGAKANLISDRLFKLASDNAERVILVASCTALAVLSPITITIALGLGVSAFGARTIREEGSSDSDKAALRKDSKKATDFLITAKDISQGAISRIAGGARKFLGSKKNSFDKNAFL